MLAALSADLESENIVEEAVSWLWDLTHTEWFCETVKCFIAVLLSLAIVLVLDFRAERP